MTILARINAGIAYLDAVYGKKWKQRIDVRKLDLKDDSSCILGQVDGSFDEERKRLKLSDRTIYALGLHGDPDGYWANVSKRSWKRLTTAWLRALER